jgi:hypothetical protein
MDDAQREPGEPADSAEAKRRRPQPVLDLKATEVAGGAAPETPSDPPESQPEPEAGPQPAAAPPPRPRTGRAVAAGALAGAVTGIAAAVAAVFLFGLTDRGAREGARIAQLESKLSALAARPAATPAAVEAVAARAAAGEQALAAVKPLQERLAQAEAALKAQPAPPADARVGRLDAATQALGGEVAALRKRLDEIAAAARTARDTAAQTAGSSQAAVATSAEEMEGLGRRVAALEAAAQALQAKAAAPAPPERDRAARFAAATLALRSAVERGDPYADELAAVRALTGDPARLKPLDEAAAAGIAGARELSRELSRLIVGIRQSADAASDDGGLIDRLQASASKLVRIRPVGEESGGAADDDPLSLVEAKAARSDVPGALAAAEKLPAPLRTPLDPWIRQARIRLAALAAARALAREALAGLGADAAAAPGRP